MILDLIELVLSIRAADRAVREKSIVGQSGLDRQSGRFVNRLCFGVIALTLFVPLVWLGMEVVYCW